jgi:hypothetical protein
VAVWDEGLVADVVRRARDPMRGRFFEQLAGCGHCARPVRIRGSVLRIGRSGEETVYSTASEPDGVLLLRCRNRRASVCPSCSYEYRGDMWQLIYAGAAGGRKGVPESVRDHPMVFVTLTAPGFGVVHTRPDDGGRCRPRRDRPPCPHGRPAWCDREHREDDPRLGEPLCLDCADHEGAVLFNWHAPELWRRFTIALRRALGRRLGIRERELRRRLRVSFAKVAEFQRRGVVHLHAIIRLDGPGDPFAAPPLGGCQ